MLNDPNKARRQGVVAVFAGIFLIVVVLGVGLFLAASIGEHRVDVSDQDTGSLFGRTFVTLALFAVAGVAGIANGVVLIRTGARNQTVFWVFVGAAIAAFGSLIFAI
jgi:hypothetical protein